MTTYDCSRRSFIRSLAAGSALLPGLVARLLADDGVGDPLAPRPPQFAGKARRVIFIYMSGGVSHVDSFDYKPKLIADHNKAFRVPEKMLAAFAPTFLRSATAYGVSPRHRFDVVLNNLVAWAVSTGKIRR